MSNVKHAGFGFLSPYIMVADVDQAIHFYQSAFGFKLRDASEEHGKSEGPSVHAEMTYEDQMLMLFLSRL